MHKLIKAVFLILFTCIKAESLEIGFFNNRLNITPFVAPSISFTQLYSVEYNFNYTLNSQNIQDSYNYPTNQLAISKSFSPYGYKAGFIVNNFMAISYSASNAKQTTSQNLTDSIAEASNSIAEKEKHSLESQKIALMLFKPVSNSTSVFALIGTGQESYKSSYNVKVYNATYENRYNLQGNTIELGLGFIVSIKKMSNITILASMQQGNLNGKLTSVVSIKDSMYDTMQNTYTSNITTDNYKSYKLEATYLITLQDIENLGGFIERIF